VLETGRPQRRCHGAVQQRWNGDVPLSEPVQRELLHLRDIAVRGFRRADGLFDVEAEITDTKTYAFGVGDRGRLMPGDKLHNMLLRITVDEGLTIVAAEASTEWAPFNVCPGGAATFGRLAGLKIRGGFLREAFACIGGVQGCTHIRELLQQMATVAVQTTYVVRASQNDASTGAGRLLNTCFAYADTGELVRQRWPEHYAGPAPDVATAG